MRVYPPVLLLEAGIDVISATRADDGTLLELWAPSDPDAPRPNIPTLTLHGRDYAAVWLPSPQQDPMP